MAERAARCGAAQAQALTQTSKPRAALPQRDIQRSTNVAQDKFVFIINTSRGAEVAAKPGGLILDHHAALAHRRSHSVFLLSSAHRTFPAMARSAAWRHGGPFRVA